MYEGGIVLRYNYLEVGKKIREEIENEELRKQHPSLDDLKTEFVECTEEGRLTLAYPVFDHQRNGIHVMQGGYITACIDNNFGIFMYTLNKGGLSTSVDLTINFHNAVTKDIDKIWVTSRVVKMGRRIAHLAAEVFDEKKRLIASCISNVIFLELAQNE